MSLSKVRIPKMKGKKRQAHTPTGDLVRMPRSPVNNVFNIVRTAPILEITASSTGTSGVLTFRLVDLSNNSDFGTLFDVFRIVAVEVTFEPVCGIAQVSTTALPVTSTLYTVIDYDDGTSISDESILRDYATVKFSPVYKRQVRRLSPKCAMSLFVSSTLSGYGQSSPGQWVDLSSAGCEWYGVKYYLSPSSLASKMKVFIKYHLQFKWIR